MKVYLDNAATTPLDPRVFEAMQPYYTDFFGNPSSIHARGREVRSAIEKARKKVADLLGTSPSEIFFTSGGTEADNTVLRNYIEKTDTKHVISSAIEHHAVTHSLDHLQKNGNFELHHVELTDKGHIEYDHLSSLLQRHPESLVSLMHGNNEIGNLTDIERVGEICHENKSFFHSDTVQTMGLYPMKLSDIKVDSIAGSAHKFHGPKGIGFMYINAEHSIQPLLWGGGQERNMRGGTENVAGIIGLVKALEIAFEDMEVNRKKISVLKEYTIEQLKSNFPEIMFNGDCASMEGSLYKILNVGLPGVEENDMLLFNLDIKGICLSGGSACASGSSVGSHVLEALQMDEDTGALRISFSKYNTIEEVDYLLQKLREYLNPQNK
jgi:cysteine desulfurase